MAFSNKALNEIVTFSRGTGATRVNAAGLIVGVDFSSTSNTIGTGSRTFTLAADANVNRDWPVGSSVIAVSQAGATGSMTGTVVSYEPSTQVLVMNVTSVTGTGTNLTNWRIGSLEFRRDFDPVTLAPKGGLVEGGETNTLATSLPTINAVGGTASQSDGISPDGSNNLRSFTPVVDVVQRYTGFGFTAAAIGVDVTLYFLLESQYRYITLFSAVDGSSNVVASVQFDLQTNSLIQQRVSNAIIYGASVVDFNGRKLVAFSYAHTGGVARQPGIIASTNPWTVSNNPGTASTQSAALYTTDGTSKIKLWGFEIYSGVNIIKTSYIPTTTVSVTRAADQLSIGGTNFSQFYNSAQGTLVMELTPIASAVGAVAGSLNDGTLNNAIRIAQKQSGTLSSIRKMATDGVTDVMAIAATTNSLRSNGVDYIASATGALSNAVGAASSALNNFLLAGDAGRYSRTTDGGLSFTNFQMIAGDQAQLNGAAFGNGTYVVSGNQIGDSTLVATIDPVTFAYTRRVSNRTQNSTAVRFLNNLFIAAINGGSDNGTGLIASADNGVTWVPQNFCNQQDARDIAFDGTTYVVVTAGQTIRFGTNLNANAASFSTTAPMLGVFHAVGIFVAVGQSGLIYTSPNGATWTLRTSGITSTLHSVMYSTRDQQWYAAGDGGVILRAADPTGTWENISNDAIAAVTNAGVIQANPFLPNLIPNQRNKVAMRLQNNSVGVSVNGNATGNDTSVSIPVVNRLSIGMNGLSGQQFNGWINSMKFYTDALDDSDLVRIQSGLPPAYGQKDTLKVNALDNLLVNSVDTLQTN